MQRHCFKALAQVAAGRLRQERRIAPHYWKLHRAETGTQTGQRLGLALLGQHWSPPQPTGFGHARKWLMPTKIGEFTFQRCRERKQLGSLGNGRLLM